MHFSLCVSGAGWGLYGDLKRIPGLLLPLNHRKLSMVLILDDILEHAAHTFKENRSFL